ncbi:MAG TPA: CTP synthase [Gammaproteobacteria bacterium]|jgi:CTP synthase|nr:CTP synthase [Gammaproteobacteria bacterium]HJP42631.1 CTP synthase [Gammaproteobacteria bacterium]
MSHYIFVTGGVVSALGKGVTSASLGAILEARGLKVGMMKLDPYLNIDPGTMSPYQHGEVFVTEDGTETDLDLGHYERYVNTTTGKNSNFTAGKIYENVIAKERKGDYLGGTVQVIPHVTDEIKKNITIGADGFDVTIIEVGGTVGDIESLPFLEAIRQMGIEENGFKVAYVHLTLVPYIKTSSEIKTKPTQHSVKELRSIGIQPDALVCRSEKPLPEEQRKKIALFTNVKEEAVISAQDASDIYEIPLILRDQGLDEIIINKLQLNVTKPDLTDWESVLLAKNSSKSLVKIAMVGKYVDFRDSYISLSEALRHAGFKTQTRIQIEYVESEEIQKNGTGILKAMDAILIPGGFGDRGIEGMVDSIQFARENKVPFLGICLGLQAAVIEFSRNNLNLLDANSTEFDPDTHAPVIALIKEWMNEDGSLENRDEDSDLGGSMRLGAQECMITNKTLARDVYQKSSVFERHRHRYEFNINFKEDLEKKGLIFSGHSKDGLVEIIELADHPWFFACQFHPEFTSSPRKGHPLFESFIQASVEYSRTKKE